MIWCFGLTGKARYAVWDGEEPSLPEEEMMARTRWFSFGARPRIILSVVPNDLITVPALGYKDLAGCTIYIPQSGMTAEFPFFWVWSDSRFVSLRNRVSKRSKMMSLRGNHPLISLGRRCKHHYSLLAFIVQPVSWINATWPPQNFRTHCDGRDGRCDWAVCYVWSIADFSAADAKD